MTDFVVDEDCPCPACGDTSLKPEDEVFIEQGEYDRRSGRYEFEGCSTNWVCSTCEFGFIVWP